MKTNKKPVAVKRPTPTSKLETINHINLRRYLTSNTLGKIATFTYVRDARGVPVTTNMLVKLPMKARKPQLWFSVSVTRSTDDEPFATRKGGIQHVTAKMEESLRTLISICDAKAYSHVTVRPSKKHQVPERPLVPRLRSHMFTDRALTGEPAAKERPKTIINGKLLDMNGVARMKRSSINRSLAVQCAYAEMMKLGKADLRWLLRAGERRYGVLVTV